MNALKKSLGLATMAALLATSTAPAMARPGWGYGGGWGYGHRHHHRGGGDGFGNFLLGAVVAGGIIAIASAASKKAKEKEAGIGNDAPRGPGTDKSAWTDAENDAANLCADAVEAMATQRGGDGGARVDDIDYVDRDGPDGYRVEGRMDNGKAFACGTSRGEVAWVQFSDGKVALR